MLFKGEVLKDQLWACARSSYEHWFNINMEKMKELNNAAYKWLKKMDPATWVRAFFQNSPSVISCETTTVRFSTNIS
jgi:hypothetical protein